MRIFLTFILLIALFWGWNLYKYTETAKREVNLASLHQVDAVIVLTGGSARLSAAMDLVKDGKAKRLFVSGVGEKVSVTDLLQQNNRSEDLKLSIMLGHEATNTKENAIEVYEWVKKEKIASLILVTSNYHMQRSLIELRKRVKNTAIYPYPVHAPTVKLDKWWKDKETAQLILREYHKLLWTKVDVDKFMKKLVR